MSRFVYGRQGITESMTLPQPRPQDYPKECWKNAPFNYVLYRCGEYCKFVLATAYGLLKREHKHILVDIKVHDLKPGEHPCLPGWHCDSVLDPEHDSRPENHIIFVTGHGCLTEFTTGEYELETTKTDPRSYNKQLSEIKPTYSSVKSCTLTKYGRWNFHRGPAAKIAEKRLLIRISETDVVRPRRQPFQVTYV